jgi:iron complex transport system substrate-binding protein
LSRRELFFLRYNFVIRIAISLLLATAVGLLSACSSKRTQPTASRAFTDEIGRQIVVATRPERIVSLAPSVTETLFALGLGDRIVGVTSFCDYPPEAQLKEKVGDTMRPSIEKIVALDPDLVVASTASQLEQFVRNLDQVGIPIYVSNPQNIDGVLSSIDRIGELTDATSRASALTEELRGRIKAVETRVARAARPRVFLILGREPLITAGGDTFISDIIARAGGRSISANEKADYPQYSLETVVAQRPEVILIQDGERELPGRLKQTPAAREGRVYHFDDGVLLRPGPRIVDGLEQMAAKLHPELFGRE